MPIWQMPEPGLKYAVGLSGGVDSVALLHLCAEHGLRPRAIHINHNMQEASAAFEQAARQICSGLGVPLTVLSGSLDPDPSRPQSEEAARDLRRSLFASELSENETLLLGHHLNDQAETFIFRAFRGSQPFGLASIAPTSLLPSGQRIFRPLLETSREQILDYAKSRNLFWVEDPTNDSPAYSRNLIRKAMPVLAQCHPHGLKGIEKTAKACMEAHQLCRQLALIDLAACAHPGLPGAFWLSQLPFDSADAPRLRNLARELAAQLGWTPSESMLENATGALLAHKTGNCAVQIGQGQWFFVCSGLASFTELGPSYRSSPDAWALEAPEPFRWQCYDKSLPTPDGKKLGEILRLACVHPHIRDSVPYLIDPQGLAVWAPIPGFPLNFPVPGLVLASNGVISHKAHARAGSPCKP